MTVVNFDRDLKYTGADLDNLGLGDTPQFGTAAVPYVHTDGVLKRPGGYVNYNVTTSVDFTNDATLSVGLLLPQAQRNDVFRVRGSMNASDAIGGQVIVGYAPLAFESVNLNNWATIAHCPRGVPEFDITLALDGVTMSGEMSTHIVVIACMWTEGTGSAPAFRPQMHLSVQDLRVAPPEYEAARR
jgi:hypothetical protein